MKATFLAFLVTAVFVMAAAVAIDYWDPDASRDMKFAVKHIWSIGAGIVGYILFIVLREKFRSCVAFGGKGLKT